MIRFLGEKSHAVEQSCENSPEEVKLDGSCHRERKNIKIDTISVSLLSLLPLVVDFTLF